VPANVEISVTGEPAADDVTVVRAGVVAHNVEAAGAEPSIPLAVLARRDATVVAGATGFTHFGWLYIHYLWVASDQRGTGLGSEILARAEAEARQRGCHAVWLDTFSFQAPGFYEKLGYQEFGRLDDFPPGHARHFVWKPLNAGPGPQQSGAEVPPGQHQIGVT
jgi:GNAT superfamily N-acetyltransferase